jgi:hypothetical protein
MLDISTYEIPLELNFKVNIYTITASPPVKLCTLLFYVSTHTHLSSRNAIAMIWTDRFQDSQGSRAYTCYEALYFYSRHCSRELFIRGSCKRSCVYLNCSFPWCTRWRCMFLDRAMSWMILLITSSWSSYAYDYQFPCKLPKMLAVAVTFSTYIQEVSGSNLG